ncbi:hypothetical protein [Alicyclobacillus tolerans]|uniref:Uncharacterized protein n=1 Tax=Alicyclobacillus tolerans TaxID=90970 RepID=A0A1M6TMZ6_9BACL|nr:hypothetical protein [Alicyclobacillus montanus]SHK58365.1 hypothetical protein SAMN05443507_11723 [Alicyclobacillus montanus]
MFDSAWEAEEWTDSLYPDTVGEGFVNVGYATPDQKVVDFLIRQIPRWAEFLRSHNPSMPAVIVHSLIDVVDGQPRYKVWIEPQND